MLNFIIMSALVTAAAIAAGANILGSIIGNSSANHQFNQQKELMKYQQELNSPKEFVRMAQEAGYNPASLYGSSTPQGNVSLGSAPDYASALSSGANMVNNAALLGAQVRNINADTDLKKEQAGMTALQSVAQRLTNEFMPKMLELDVQGKEFNNLLTQATEGLTKANRKKVVNETIKVKKECDVMTKNLEILDETLRKVKSEANIAELQAKFTPQLIKKNLEEINSRIANNAAMVEQAHAAVQDLLAGKSLKEVQKTLIDNTMQFSVEEAQAKKEAAKTNAVMLENEYEVQKAGQVVNEYLSPARSLFSTFGSLFGGLSKFVK